MEKQEIKKNLLYVISNIKKIDTSNVELESDANFMQIFNLDSLDAVQLTTEINQKFGITFGDSIDDVDALQNWGRFVELIHSRQTIAA